jgi:hypothetical protein
VVESIKARLGRSIEADQEDRQSNMSRAESQNALREKVLRRLKRERSNSKGNLIEAIKGMSESQLNTISKMLKIKKGQDDMMSQVDDEGPRENNYTGSFAGETEADELNDKVDELQDALLLD